jgi:hypothetical protein
MVQIATCSLSDLVNAWPHAVNPVSDRKIVTMLTARLNSRDNANLKSITDEREVDRIVFI